MLLKGRCITTFSPLVIYLETKLLLKSAVWHHVCFLQNKKKKNLLWFSFYINDPSDLLDPTANMKQANKQNIIFTSISSPWICMQPKERQIWSLLKWRPCLSLSPSLIQWLEEEWTTKELNHLSPPKCVNSQKKAGLGHKGSNSTENAMGGGDGGGREYVMNLHATEVPQEDI